MRSLANREQNQKNAAYNLGVAEAIRIHKNEKPEFYVSLSKISIVDNIWICEYLDPFSVLQAVPLFKWQRRNVGCARLKPHSGSGVVQHLCPNSSHLQYSSYQILWHLLKIVILSQALGRVVGGSSVLK